jgi:signal transduction histidine kinase/CheY-like chemotaxis protein
MKNMEALINDENENGFERGSRNILTNKTFASVLLFFLWLATAKFGQYIFFSHQTSPALIWAPSGISLAFVLLYGYRMWVPIALASFLATLTSPTSPHFVVILAATIGQTLQPIIGAYLLKRFGFVCSFKKTSSVLKFILVSIFIACIAPSIITLVQYLSNNLTAPFFVAWTRSWAGRLLSIIVLTPLLLTWLPWRKFKEQGSRLAEVVVVFVALLTIIYVLFWTTYAASYSFLLLVALFGNLFWIAMRFGSRSMSLSIFLLTSLGMAGAIIAHPSPQPLNQQLFSIELFVVLIAPIFILFSALLNERRLAVLKLQENMNELKRAMEKLSNEDRSKNEFIAILAHELRNPLAPIRSTLELLKLEEQTPEALRMIEIAEVQTRAMKRLLDDLLDVARIVQKNFKLNKQVMDLNSAIQNSVYSTENIMKKYGHTFIVISLINQKISIEADQVRFEQVIVNLLNNAAKYTKPGGHIELSFKVSGDKLEISVKDNGIGISSKDIAHIFEPFRQINPTPSHGTGLGIGLSLARRLVEMHEGELTAESEGVGKGSKFKASFPITIESEIIHQSVENMQKNKLQNKESFKILVVDDNEPAAEALGKLLEYKGHEVNLAFTGESAVLAVAKLNPQIVLLDIGLPDIDGYMVAEKLRSNNFSGTLIALTGYGQDEDKLKAKKAGFNHFLVKPIGIAELEGILI